MDCFLNNPNLPTALIALLVALITFNQYRVAKAKLKLDLFERRFNIFHKAWTSLSEAVIDESKIQQYGFWSPFNNDLHEASFLFGKKVTKYLDKCVYQWNQLRTYSIEKKSVPPGGHLIMPHPWPGQNASPSNGGTRG